MMSNIQNIFGETHCRCSVPTTVDQKFFIPAIFLSWLTTIYKNSCMRRTLQFVGPSIVRPATFLHKRATVGLEMAFPAIIARKPKTTVGRR